MSSLEKNNRLPTYPPVSEPAPPSLKSPSRRFITGNRMIYLLVFAISILAGLCILLVEPLIVFGGVVGLLAFVALFINPFLGVLAYLVFEYASVSEMYTFTQVLQLGKLIVLSTIAAWGIKAMVRRKLSLVSDKITIWFVIWCVAGIISNFGAIEQARALQGTLDVMKWFMIYLMIINVIDTLPKWKGCMWIFLLLAFKMSQFQIRTYEVGLEQSQNADFFIREGLGSGDNAFFGNAGDFGVFMCVTLPLAFALINAVNPKILKAIGAVFIGFFLVSILRSGARGNTVGMFATGLVYWCRSSQKVLIGLSLVILGTVYWITAPDVVKDRFMSAASEKKDSTATHRLVLWKAGLAMFVANPLTGVGVYNFGAYYLANYATPEDMNRATAPHNLFVQCLSETGLLGIVSLLALIILMFVRNRQTRALLREHHRHNKWINSFAMGLDLALVGYLVSGSFLSVLYYPHLFMILSLIVSLHNITHRRIAEGIDTIEVSPASVKVALS